MSEQPPIIADSPRSEASSPVASRKAFNWRWAVAVAVALALAAGLWLWLERRELPDPAPTPPALSEAAKEREAAPDPPPNPEPEPASLVELGMPDLAPETDARCPPIVEQASPPLDDSDGFVREHLICLGALMPQWLQQVDLARRAATLLQSASVGKLPRRPAPPGPFQAMQRNGELFVHPASWRRYDAVVDALTCLPPERAAALAQTFEPLLIAALAELGLNVAAADAQLLEALAQVEATPMPPGFLALKRPKVLYEYADPELEALPSLQKQLLRMGPANLSRLQDYARDARAALGRQAEADCPGTRAGHRGA